MTKMNNVKLVLDLNQNDPFEASTEKASLSILLKENEKYKSNFRNNLLFKLMQSNYFNTQQKKNTLLDYFQTWSSHFQQMIFLRIAYCSDPDFIPIFHKHFVEEYGHDKILLKERNNRPLLEDTILESLCNWFPSKVISFTPHEQIVLINLCLEASSVIFHEYAIPALDPELKLNYFRLHEEVDTSHEKMGNYLLKDLEEFHYKKLLLIQERAWQMFEALINRIAELCIKSEQNK